MEFYRGYYSHPSDHCSLETILLFCRLRSGSVNGNFYTSGWSTLLDDVLLQYFHLTLKLLLQGANLSNTYFDYKSGVDSSKFPCGDRVLVDKKIEPLNLLLFSIICYIFGIGSIFSLLMTDQKEGNQMLQFTIITGVLVAFFYTAKPFALKYTALGDIAIFFSFGPLLMQATSIILVGKMEDSLYYYAIPIGKLSSSERYVSSMVTHTCMYSLLFVSYIFMHFPYLSCLPQDSWQKPFFMPTTLATSRRISWTASRPWPTLWACDCRSPFTLLWLSGHISHPYSSRFASTGAACCPS